MNSGKNLFSMIGSINAGWSMCLPSKNYLRAAALALAIATFCSIAALGQFSGNIQGDVHDQSGAAIPNATVNLTNSSTGITVATKTDQRGDFRFVSLAPGSYKLAVSMTGFSPAVLDVKLLTNQTANLPVSLNVGATEQSVQVTTQAPLLDTADSRTQATIETQELTDLPLQGRNLLALATLAPGVTGLGLARGGAPGSAADNFSTETSVDANANGRGNPANSYVVDGLDVTSNIRPGVLNLTPNPDTIQETSVQTNTYSSEYGRASSVEMVMTTKSGTNKFHGSASDYFTYQNLWALTEFAPAGNRKYAPFHSNNMSATVGGPIWAKHQLFFFAAIEPLRSTQTTANSSILFEDPQFTQWAKGNFANSLGTQILTQDAPTRATITAVAKTAKDIFPKSCGTQATSNLPCSLPMVDKGLFNSSAYRNGTQWNTRIDKYFSRDRLYGNVFRTTLQTGTPSIRPAFDTSNHFVTNAVQVNETHTFTSTLLNEAAFGVNKVEGVQSATGNFTVPSISVSFQSVGFGIGFAQGDFIQHNYQWRDVLTKVIGSHVIRAGYDGKFADDLALFAKVHNQPSFQFNNLLELVQDSPYSESQLAYDPVTGKPAAGQYKYALVTHGGFAQDTWKARKNITVVYGMRFDEVGNPYAQSGSHISNFYLGSGATLDEQVANGSLRVTDNVYKRVPLSFSPRVGVTLDPTGSGKWLLNGGFGLYHDWPTLANDESNINNNPPAYIVPTFYRGSQTSQPIFALGTSASTPAGFPYPALPGLGLDSHGGLVGSQANIGGIDPNLRTPNTFIYTITGQREIRKDFVVSVGYSGSNSNDLVNGSGQASGHWGDDINRFAGDLLTHRSPTRLNASFGRITYAQNQAVSRYNALIVSARARFAHHGTFNASYTRSESHDDAGIYPTYSNIKQYYGPSVWEAPNRFSMYLAYELPGFGAKNGFAGRLSRGWTLSDVTILQSGTPFVVFTNAPFPSGGDYNADGDNYDYPDASSYSQGHSRHAYLTGIFSPGQFSAPTPGTEGNEKTNQFRGPGYANSDMSVVKYTHLTESVQVALRGDFFNAFNRPNLRDPNGNLPQGTFGQSTGQFNPRWIQLGASIRF